MVVSAMPAGDCSEESLEDESAESAESTESGENKTTFSMWEQFLKNLNVANNS